jgi:pilus assembly protein CpaB
MKPFKLDKLRNFRPSRTWIVLGVALIIGALAAFAARSYLTSQMAAIDARGKGKTMAVVVAKADIGKGVKLSSANVAVREIPVEFAHSVAVTPDNFERINGQMLAYPVKGGEMILWGLMESQKVPTFSARVETGHRAMTVPVDEINSISGMLEPGDTIDLMVSVDQKGRKVTFPLLQRVQVMATGQRSVDDPKSGERRQYSTVTIDTTPKQAHNVIVAREVGKLTALLRNPDDKQVIGTGGYDIAALLGQKDGANPAGPARIGKKGIPVIYGGNLASLPPEALRLARQTAPAGRQGNPSAAAPSANAPPAAAPNPTTALQP